MRTLFTLLTVTCLITGCSNQQSTTETAGTDTGTRPSTSDSAETPSETARPAEASSSEETTAASEEPKPLVIDVRTQAEWDAGHLEIATHIPLDQITDRIGEVAPDKDQKIYLHCRSGGRSGQAKTELEGLGYTNVENAGGLEDARAKFESDDN
ncbi:hypothetical protein GC176_00225 [bacterium]|nr:hypothetical protein [bacterium]